MRQANRVPTALPTQLNTIERLDLFAAAVTRQMVLAGGGGRSINGQRMTSMADMMDLSPALRVRPGELWRWNVDHSSRDTYLFHMHDSQSHSLDRNAPAPGPGELGRKTQCWCGPWRRGPPYGGQPVPPENDRTGLLVAPNEYV